MSAYSIINAVGFIALLWMMVKSISQIIKHGPSTTHALVTAHCLLAALPIASDATLGVPEYAHYQVYKAAVIDPVTGVFYALYMVAFPLVLLIGRSTPRSHYEWKRVAAVICADLNALQPLLWIAILAPVVYFAVAAPEYTKYLEYGAVTQNVFTLDEYRVWSAVTSLTYPAIFALFGFILLRRKLATLLVAVPFLSFALYLHGKRNSVFLAVVLVLSALALSRSLKGRTLLWLGLAAVGGYLAYHQWYQTRYRPYLADQHRSYESLRMDFGHDGDIKLAIYSELYLPDRPILDYRFQSAIFNVTFFIPRTYWPEKPWPYYCYLTARALGIHNATALTWGFTSSVLGEAIANCGWLGMLVAPLLFRILCHVGHRSRSVLFGLVTTVLAVQCLMLTPGNNLAIIMLWVGLGVLQSFTRLCRSPLGDRRMSGPCCTLRQVDPLNGHCRP